MHTSIQSHGLQVSSAPSHPKSESMIDMDLQQDTLNWVPDTNSWLSNDSCTVSFFDPPIDDYFDNIYPKFEWDETYIDPIPTYSSTTSTFSNTVSALSNTVECSDVKEARAIPITYTAKLDTTSSRSTSPETVDSIIRAPKRRRARLQLDHTTSSPRAAPSIRVPHRQVERKYRDGLNSIMEQLRMTVPSTARWEISCSSPTNPRPSKAMVLASAIDYIKEVEEERDVLAKEMESTRQ